MTRFHSAGLVSDSLGWCWLVCSHFDEMKARRSLQRWGGVWCGGGKRWDAVSVVNVAPRRRCRWFGGKRASSIFFFLETAPIAKSNLLQRDLRAVPNEDRAFVTDGYYRGLVAADLDGSDAAAVATAGEIVDAIIVAPHLRLRSLSNKERTHRHTRNKSNNYSCYFYYC